MAEDERQPIYEGRGQEVQENLDCPDNCCGRGIRDGIHRICCGIRHIGLPALVIVVVLFQIVILAFSVGTYNKVADKLDRLDQNVEKTEETLTRIVNTLSIQKNISIRSEGITSDTFLTIAQNMSLPRLSSCEDIRPDSHSGYYYINSELVYCEMGELCGSEGGWTRLAYLDMSDSTMDCPTGFRLYESDDVRACGRPTNYKKGSCISIEYPSHGIQYSKVCGRVVGYQYGSPDAVKIHNGEDTIHNDINSYYVDGVSITHTPNVHIWTLMAGTFKSTYSDGNCPCSSPPGSKQQIQSFVGDNYYCASGNPSSKSKSKLYTAYPLWEGEVCSTKEKKCCSYLPWFHRSDLDTTSESIKIGVCGDEGTDNEDVPISFFEIYVKS